MSPRTASPRSRASAFAALGDETRLRMLARLGAGSASIAALTRGVSISRQAVAKHLRVLERARMVEAHRAGRERRYSLNPAAFDELEAFLARVSRSWDTRLSRLKQLAESSHD